MAAGLSRVMRAQCAEPRSEVKCCWPGGGKSKINIKSVRPENWINKDLLVSSESSPAEHEADPFFRNLKRPNAPNNYLIAPNGFPSNPDEPSPAFSVGVERLRTAFEDAAVSLPGISKERPDGTVHHYVAQTSLCRFKDDIHVQFIDLGGGWSTLAAYSASRIGYWDLGKNRRRLRELLAFVGERLGM